MPTKHKLKFVLSFVFIAFIIRVSSRLQKSISLKYWKQLNVPTHGNSNFSDFDLYYEGINSLISKNDGLIVLDYGGGYGELAEKFKSDGYSVEIAEFSEAFREVANQKGIPFREATNLPDERYDIIIANNCLFYVHPRNLRNEIKRILMAIKPGGTLIISDTPTIEGINHLYPKGFLRYFSHLTHVYQPHLGGFFLDGNILKKEFGAEVLQSWSIYREHFIINR